MANLETILSWFQTGDNPTEEEFRQTFSSFRHNDTKIPIKDVDGLESSLNNKLNVDDLPANMALVDEGETSDVFNKEQIMAMTMMLSDYVKNGKIRADKIEAIGLTDLIEAVEKNIVEFAANSEKYEFQQNDFIAVPINENFSLFMFKGGEKKDKNNYLPTGISNVTIAMVEGLQTVLNGKLDKPLADGSFFTKKTGSSTIQKEINPGANYLLFWDETDFKSSNLYRDSNSGRVGVGTTTPKEQIHLTERARMTGLVLDENSEVLPQQVTYSNRRFYGTDSTGVKRSLMYADINDITGVMESLTDSQKDAWRAAQRKIGENYSLGQPKVIYSNPPLVKKQPGNQSIVLLGENLFLDTSSSTLSYVKIVHIASKVSYTIPTISVNQFDPRYLSFGFDFTDLPLGKYRFEIFNHLTQLSNIDSTIFELVTDLESIDLTSITWEKLISINSDYSAAYAIDKLINIPNMVSSASDAGRAFVAFKSSEILDLAFLANNDVILKFIVNNNSYNFSGDRYGYTFGLNNSDIPLNLDNVQELVGVRNNGGHYSHIPVNSELYYQWSLSNVEHKITIIIRGNLATFITVIGTSIYVQYITIDIVKGLSFFFFANNNAGAYSTGSMSLNILDIIKIPK